MNKSRTPDFKIIVFSVITILWLGLGFLYLSQDITKNFKGYSLLIRLPLEAKRAVTTGEDFYRFIKICDHSIPGNQDLEWVFPAGNYLGYNEYYFYKAYYFLYPRNYRKNANYIIVYKAQGYQAPEGYKLVAEFGKDKYILAK